ncbi:PREDICTED: uncharacterized protein LOC108568090 [Nicrophorus vespilloides]|uniref:Uncharacterized protein LOC108568090 n=1 Tax=Nicrophorus vespilloides TaxID=110193 RepID=A0ABM1NCE3_NICVS|nr:PREDICTED: uncharacterized protein LOC108568090 [Nicrophorus vespilloides]
MRSKVVLVVLTLAVFVRSNPIDANQLQITSAQRGIWDVVGNWIQGSDWFPIQINIPQTFGSIGNGIMTFANGIVQRIPFINNRPEVVRPRPHNYMIVVPLHKDNNYLNEEVLTYP